VSNDQEPLDEVFLEGLRFYAYHGNNPEERVQGQRFLVDVVISADLTAAGKSDDLTQTISYSDVFRRIKAIVEGEPHKLIETLAQEIAGTILAEVSLARAVTVTVRKPEVAIKGSILEAAGVKIHRKRE
jgi:dihydroneopterin aldolase